MITLKKEKRITIVGMGLTGLSCARFFSYKGINFRIIDSRKSPPLLDVINIEFPKVEICCGDLSKEVFGPNDILVVSPGMSLKESIIASAINNGAKISSDIELFLAEVNLPIIAITGSNGKSTVTTLVGDMLRQSGMNVCVAGNIGLPVLEQLISGKNIEVFVLELSSFQLERLQDFHAKAVTILNVTEDHLDRYSSFTEYHKAKQNIFMGAENIIINRDDHLTSADMPNNVKSISYGLSRPSENSFGLKVVNDKEFIYFADQEIIAIDNMKIKGRHNIANAMAAIALCRTLGLAWQPMIKTLKEFPGLRHRCEWVDEVNGVNFYNDSKATNVGAAIAAISGFPKGQGRLILLAGGLDKDSNFIPLGEIVRNNIAKVYLIGKDAQKLYQAFGSDICSFAKDLTDAVNQAFHFAVKGDVVLLAPACASFDMFKNYEHRGDVFVAAVRELKVANL